MQGWSEGISAALEYIENNLTEKLDADVIAAQANVSNFYFQKIFCALSGFTVGEYIRNRRLSQAASELTFGNEKVIDVALKYGYDSPDSFTRAFCRFHGVTPSCVSKGNVELKYFAPLKIKLTLEGGKMLEYKIVKKAQFTAIGISRKFCNDTSYCEIPKFWNEHMQSEFGKEICGTYGICIDNGGCKNFTYLIADDYAPWKEYSGDLEMKYIPEHTYAVFPCRGKLPESLQTVNTKIWSEWLPACNEFAIADNFNIEYYAPLGENSEEDYCEIWIPVKAV